MKDKEDQEPVQKTVSDLSGCVCRICQTAKSREQLISPCNCKGTLGKVHLSCLEKWLNFCGRQYCEICKYHFQVRKTRRYGIIQSVRIWVRHPRHRIHLRSDLIIGFILTIITIALCCICAFGIRYFITEGVKLGIPSVYSEGVILIFMAVIVLGYSVTIYLMCKDHVVPWYRYRYQSMFDAEWIAMSFMPIRQIPVTSQNNSFLKELKTNKFASNIPRKEVFIIFILIVMLVAYGVEYYIQHHCQCGINDVQ